MTKPKGVILSVAAFQAERSISRQKCTRHVTHLEHRMRTFHASPDYALWYGWSEMQRDLTEIKELSTQMRRERQGVTLKPALK